ncbi:MAG: carboxypeptidase regulatory-like domain-containing protein [Leptospiraceae bacterium]|nr:carboxypeptidase regulatory-like domain-containing protein [Leptospiraceae bacterium]
MKKLLIYLSAVLLVANCKKDNKDDKDLLLGATVLASQSAVASSSNKTVITGSLKDSNGNVLAGATLTITDSSGNAVTVTTDSKGLYTVTLASGTYSVSVKNSAGAETGTYSLSVNGNYLSNVTVSNASGVTAKIEGASRPSVELFGTLKDTSGNLLSNATISISNLNSTSPSWLQRATDSTSKTLSTSKTDTNGKFKAYLQTGASYKLNVKKADNTNAGSLEVSVTGTDSSGISVTNQTGLAASLDSAKEANTKVGGTLTDSNNTSLSNTTVNIKDSEGNVVVQTTTDASGNYTAVLPAGQTYTASTTTESGSTGSFDVAVTGTSTDSVSTSNATDITTTITAVTEISGASTETTGTQTLTYTLGGTVSGLNGTLVLQNYSANDTTITADGNFTFATALSTGSSYSVTVKTQPTGQTCSVTNGTGTISAIVSNVTVTCATITYTIGGTVSGLSGSVILQNNSGDDKTITADGNFSFATAINYNTTYSVTIKTQPTGQSCSVSSGNGTATDNVTNVSVTCVSVYTIGGTVSGLTASGLVLQNNSGNDLTIESGANNFVFSTSLFGGGTYSVSILTQPSGHICKISNGSGTANANVTNINVSCCAMATETYDWGTFTDQCNGTVKFVGLDGTFAGTVYSAQTLIFMKCTQGQQWNSTTNDCTGTGSSGDNYGADNSKKEYCPSGSTCDNGTILTSGPSFDSCNTLDFAGKTNWRVPTINEIRTIIHCTDKTIPQNGSSCGTNNYTTPAISNLFPNTAVATFYWSSSPFGSPEALRTDFTTGAIGSFYKSTLLYVRCVSGP